MAEDSAVNYWEVHFQFLSQTSTDFLSDFPFGRNTVKSRSTLTKKRSSPLANCASSLSSPPLAQPRQATPAGRPETTTSTTSNSSTRTRKSKKGSSTAVSRSRSAGTHMAYRRSSSATLSSAKSEEGGTLCSPDALCFFIRFFFASGVLWYTHS
jgi:hypothetical protein